MKSEYDIVIVGGGMVGASLACALVPVAESLDLDIAIVEPVPLRRDGLNYQPSYDARSTALAYGSRSAYERMGVWQTLRRHLTPIRDIHVSDRGRFGATRLSAAQQRVPALGYVVENHWLGQVLLDRLQQPDANRVDYLCPAEVAEVRPGADGMALTLSRDGRVEQLRAQLVVMADGGRSELREALGIGYRYETYDQHALVANVSLDRAHGGVAWERFTDQGPMALLPLEEQQGQHRCGLIWTLSDDEAEQLLAADDARFLAELQRRFGYRAGRFVRVGERHGYPLKLVLAEEQVRPGLVVLGNAAHALHPIAGQGYNLALRGLVALADHLIDARRQGRRLGDLEVLQAYHEWMHRDQRRTIGFSDRTMKLFSNASPLQALGRDLGLQLLDLCPAAKTLFARAAMGLESPAPMLGSFVKGNG
ncbi:2-octaprenyl-6-methoxyphenyl hydroxylase [Marinobacterium nitratireducens]|uniref:2-octaprenyl-6-methoxyphenyl hydroxylase n=1 Tax=Marinobacterium nitratireducens TaxID=518897 RepID=A0A918DY03_9GAMM|nr:2-octaprenyl-6-methoxyphenyl hydroxylase [Marinobacterium nitratireducens]GGO87735.1 2-octaprenyl-6-methoxyphenyl hydroxylase [Marinobacterium nitratireducens]